MTTGQIAELKDLFADLCVQWSVKKRLHAETLLQLFFYDN